MAKTENLQNTLSVKLGGETIVSRPFDFEAFCLVDDMRYGAPPIGPTHLGTATNLVGEAGASTLAKFANVTKMSQDNFDRLGSSIVALGNNFATTESDIANMSMRLGGAGTQIGLNQADILGIATALSSVGIEAEAGGSAFSKAMINMQLACSTGFTQINAVTQKTGKSLRDLQLMSSNNSKAFKSLADGLGYTSDELNSMISSGAKLENFAKITGKTTAEFKDLFDSNPTEAINAFIKGLQNAEESGTTAIEMLQDLGFTEVRLRDSLTRLANSESGITEAVDMSNKAWEENTALLNEFNAKAETTASQIQITKNNLVEAARSIGETFLPTIKDVSGNIAEFAQNIAKLDDKDKEKIINIATALIGFGAGAKVISSTTKGIGGFVESLGKLGVALPSLASAGPVLLAIAGGIAAVAVAYGSYKKYKYDQRNFGKEITAAADALKDAKNEAGDFNEQINKLNNLKIKINSGELNPEELSDAKKQIEDIHKYIIDNFGDQLSTESLLSGVVSDEDIARLQKALSIKQEISKITLQTTITDDKEKFDNAQEQVPELTSQRDALVETNRALEERELILRNYLDAWNTLQQSDSYVTADYAEQQKQMYDLFDKMNNELSNKGLNKVSNVDSSGNAVNPFGITTSDLNETLGAYEANEKQIGTLATNIKEYNNSIAIYKQNVRDFIDTLISELPYAAEMGTDAVSNTLSRIGTNGENAELSFEEMGIYAERAAAQLNGFKTAAEAAGAGSSALNQVAQDTVWTLSQWGYSAQEAALQGALLKTGFKNIAEAANAEGGLEKLSQAATDYAHALGMIPEEQKITFTADFVPEGKKVDDYKSEEEQKKGTVVFDVDETKVKEYEPPEKEGRIVYKASISSPIPNAKGTQNFPGGLAMINDQTHRRGCENDSQKQHNRIS